LLGLRWWRNKISTRLVKSASATSVEHNTSVTIRYLGISGVAYFLCLSYRCIRAVRRLHLLEDQES
jgi:hypothetical protein